MANDAQGPESYRYDAFISYRHVEPDRSLARWLHRSIETYRTPRRLVREKGTPSRTKPVFRDEDELPASADLNHEIETALEQSRFLIVVCSPRTPQSEWVNKEAVRFRELGRGDRILALLIEGEPRDSFPRALLEIRRTITETSGLTREQIEEVEPLAADVRPSRKEGRGHVRRMARLRMLAAILGCRFDDLRRREHERRVRSLTIKGIAAGLLALLLAVMAVQVVRSWSLARMRQEMFAKYRDEGQTLLRGGDGSKYRLAVMALENALKERDDPGVRALLDEARAAKDRWDALQARFESLLSRGKQTVASLPAEPDALNDAHRGQLAAALTQVQEALTCRPSDGEALALRETITGLLWPGVPDANPVALRERGFDRARKGLFREAMAHFQRAAFCGDKPAAQAAGLVTAYLATEDRRTEQTRHEYDRYVQWVSRCLDNALIRPEAPDRALQEQLRTAHAAAAVIAGTLPRTEVAGGAWWQDDQAAAKALHTLGRLRGAIESGLAILRSSNRPYAAAVLKGWQQWEQDADQAAKAWESLAGAKDAKAVQQAYRGLYEPNEDLACSTQGVGDMLSPSPPQACLTLAKKAVGIRGESARQEEWCRRLIARLDRILADATVSEDWAQAYQACSALTDIDPAGYQSQLALIDCRLDAMGLYGKGDPRSPNADASDWRVVTADADPALAGRVAELLDQAYVSQPDLPGMIRGGMNRIKAIVQVAEATEHFPGLGDAAKRANFLKAVQGELAGAGSAGTDLADWTAAFRRVLDSSERTVQIPAHVLAYEFYRGSLAALGPLNSIYWPRDLAAMQGDKDNKCGIGVQARKDRGEYLTIVSPLPGSPAVKAGLFPGDRILTIDGKSTRGMTLKEAVALLAGREGSSVELQVAPSETAQPTTLTVERKEVTVASVRPWRLSQAGIPEYRLDAALDVAYVRVTQMSMTTADEFHRALESMGGPWPSGLVLDLRRNGGGILTGAIAIIDEFLSGGMVLALQTRGDPLSRFEAHTGGSYENKNVVVLIDESTASGAEIIAGALRDHGRALVIGSRSHGVGSIENLVELGKPGQQKGLLKLTRAYFQLPSGDRIQRLPGEMKWGVSPDVPVALTPRQSQRCLGNQLRTELVYPWDRIPVNADEFSFATLYDVDVALRTAVLMLRLEDCRHRSSPPATQPQTAPSVH